jgi:hypothetical protein
MVFRVDFPHSAESYGVATGQSYAVVSGRIGSRTVVTVTVSRAEGEKLRSDLIAAGEPIKFSKAVEVNVMKVEVE